MLFLSRLFIAPPHKLKIILFHIFHILHLFCMILLLIHWRSHTSRALLQKKKFYSFFMFTHFRCLKFCSCVTLSCSVFEHHDASIECFAYDFIGYVFACIFKIRMLQFISLYLYCLLLCSNIFLDIISLARKGQPTHRCLQSKFHLRNSSPFSVRLGVGVLCLFFLVTFVRLIYFPPNSFPFISFKL